MDLERFRQFSAHRMLTETSRFLSIGFAALLTVSSARAQSTGPVYEQLALNYFADVILQTDTLLKGYRANYDGWVDSSITTIPFTTFLQHRTDSLIQSAYGDTQTASAEFWRTNVRPPFQLTVRSPIKAKNRRSYPLRSRVARPLVYHHLQLGERVYVEMKVLLSAGDYGISYYLTFDRLGRVLEFSEVSFVY